MAIKYGILCDYLPMVGRDLKLGKMKDGMFLIFGIPDRHTAIELAVYYGGRPVRFALQPLGIKSERLECHCCDEVTYADQLHPFVKERG